jgi:hypothetical protein
MNAIINKEGELVINMGKLNAHESKSGKSIVLASTEGNKSVPLTVDGKNIVAKIGVNCYTDK